MIEKKYNNKYEYVIEDRKVKISKYIGINPTCVIPTFLDGCQVEAIGEDAFRDLTFVSKVELPSTITRIEKYAFCGCNNLLEINLLGNTEFVGAHAFYNCRSLQKISLRGELKEIGDGAFKNCSSVYRMDICTESDKVYAIKYPLDSLLQDLEIKIEYRGEIGQTSILYFPKDEVFYSYYTNRINDKTTFGVGNNYHNCVGNGVIDYKRYDNLFLGAINYLAPKVLKKIALNRLMYPYLLSLESRNKYKDYVLGNLEEIIKNAIVLEENRIIDYTMIEELIDSSLIEVLILYSIEHNKVEATSKLLTYKKNKFSKRNLTFDL